MNFNTTNCTTREEALEYIQKDEYVEVTPKSLRLRKIYLNEKPPQDYAVKFIETSKQLALTNEELEQKENQVSRLEDQLSEGDTCMVELQNRYQVQEEENVQVSGLFEQKRLEWESQT